MIRGLKLLSTLFGAIVGAKFGPIGAIFGAFAGYALADWLLPASAPYMAQQGIKQLGAHTQKVFFATTFSVMGFIAKSDGRVSEQEIRAAELIMQRLDLTASQRREAIEFFREGKKTDFRWRQACDRLLEVCNNKTNLLRVFVEIQIETAYAEGPPSAFKHKLLAAISDWLGLRQHEFLQLEQMIAAAQRFRTYNKQRESTSSAHHPRPLADAYQVLGVKSTDDKQTITRAYRKLISEHHPDKLVSRGLPEAMIKHATEKTHQIKQAYDLIRQQRHF